MRLFSARRVNVEAQSTRIIMLAGLMALLILSACARLGPLGEPDVDWQSMEFRKSVMRDGQRAASDLRIELSDRRKELAEANVIRAQLEGMLRETERRLAEARQIIELQREELTAAHIAHDRLQQAGEQMHSRLRRLEKQLARVRRRDEKPAEIVPSSHVPSSSTQSSMSHSQPVAQPIMVAETVTDGPVGVANEDQSAASTVEDASRIIVVREGETLWRLAKRHRVALEELRRVNGLTDDRIIAGWTLRVPLASHVAGMHPSGLRRLGR